MRNTSEKRQVGRTARLVSGVATAGLAVGLLAGTAGAAGVSPVTDYASYPSPLPAGCPGGEQSLVGALFDNGRGNTASDLRKLPLRSGDTLTMTWDSLAPSCEGLVVTLAFYSTHSVNFDPHSNETLLTFVSWTGGPTVLSLVVPHGTDEVRYLQVDAVLGAPLAVIGPDGTFYNSVLRRDGGPNTLVSAKNFAAEVAAPAPEAPTPPPAAEAPVDTTPPPAPQPEAPAPAPAEPAPVEVESVPTPTTAAPAPAPAPPAVAPAVATAPPTTTPTPEVEVLSEVAQRPAALPRTGASTGLFALIGAGLLAAGAAVRQTGRKLQGS